MGVWAPLRTTWEASLCLSPHREGGGRISKEMMLPTAAEGLYPARGWVSRPQSSPHLETSHGNSGVWLLLKNQKSDNSCWRPLSGARALGLAAGPTPPHRPLAFIPPQEGL